MSSESIGWGMLFYLIALFFYAVSYLYFFLWMLPGMAAAFLLGRCKGVVFLTKHVLEDRWEARPGYRKFYRFYGWRWTLAALAWDGAALALSVFLGCFNGWLITYTQRGRVLGGLLAAGCFVLGHWFPAGVSKK